MRRAPQDGQNPRGLQLKASSLSWPHSPQRSGFLSDDERESRGRPVGVAVGPDRRSLLVADDVGDVVWRVSAAN